MTIPAGICCQWAPFPMGNMDLRDRLAGSLRKLHLVMISIEDWVLIQRDSFDIHIDEEPYHALQIYANIAKKKYIIRAWGTSFKSGTFSSAEELALLCSATFGRTMPCLGYLGSDPGGMSLVQVRHPCPRWISKSCSVTFDKNQSGLIVGLCPACSGEKTSGTNHLVEEVPIERKSSVSLATTAVRRKQVQNHKSSVPSDDHHTDDTMDSFDRHEVENQRVENTHKGEPRQVSSLKFKLFPSWQGFCFKATHPVVLIFSHVLSSPSLQERKRLKPEPIVKEGGGSQTQNGNRAEKVTQEKEARVKSQDKKADLQTCDKCGKVLKGIDTLRYHIKAVHENLREWKCDEPGCDKAFVESHQLDK